METSSFSVNMVPSKGQISELVHWTNDDDSCERARDGAQLDER